MEEKYEQLKIVPASEVQTNFKGTQEYLDTMQILKNLQYEIRGLNQKLKDIEARQEAIWNDVNLLLSRPLHESYPKKDVE